MYASIFKKKINNNNNKTQECMGEVENLAQGPVQCVVYGVGARCHAQVSEGALCIMPWSLVQR